MRRNHSLAMVAVLCAAVVLAGCRMNPAPRVVARYREPWDARLRSAGYHGIYGLHARTAGQRRAVAPPLLRVRLTPGQRFGFIRDRAHGLVAVAAGERVFLDEANAYVWHMRADRGQMDRKRTTLLVVGVVAGVLIVIGAFAYAPLGTGASWAL